MAGVSKKDAVCYTLLMTSPYDFQNVVAIKILVKREDKVLLIREPEFNDWMPNKLGLPGGKPLINETLRDTISRKAKSEIGFEIAVRGIVRIQNIIMPNYTAYHVILAADHLSGEIDTSNTESKDIAWYGLDEITKLNKDDFTEFYNDKIIKQYLQGELTPIPMSYVTFQDNRSDAIAGWMERSTKNS